MTRSLFCAFPTPVALPWLCFFAVQVFLDGDAATFDCFAVSFERSLFAHCDVRSGFVGVPWIGESLLGVLEAACRRAARFVALLLFPEAFKRFLDSARRPSLGEARRSVDLLNDVERLRGVGCGIKLLLGLFCCDTDTAILRQTSIRAPNATSTILGSQQSIPRFLSRLRFHHD